METKVNSLLYRFCKGIEKIEGYYVGSTSWRNNSSGNLRWSKFQVGIRNGFSYFNSYQAGFDALVYDVKNKALGNTNTSLTGESTILDFAKVWAPSSDNNNPENYAKFLSNYCGLQITTKLKVLVAPDLEQRFLVFMLNFSPEKERDIVNAVRNLETWFSNLGVSTSTQFISKQVGELPVVTVMARAGQDDSLTPHKIVDPEYLRSILASSIKGNHFTMFCYRVLTAGLTPVELGEQYLNSYLTQLPILDPSSPEWIEMFLAHELMHGYYFRANAIGLTAKDDVHSRVHKDTRPNMSYDDIIVKLKPNLEVMLKKELPTEVLRQQYVSTIQFLINLIKSLFAKGQN